MLENILNDAVKNVYYNIQKKIIKEIAVKDISNKMKIAFTDYNIHLTQYATVIGYTTPVEIKEIFVEPFLINSNSIQDSGLLFGKYDFEKRSEIIEGKMAEGKAIKALKLPNGYSLITGPPGIGKSTLAKYITMVGAEKLSDDIPIVKDKIPFYIPVKDLSSEIAIGFSYDWRSLLNKLSRLNRDSISINELKEKYPISYIEYLMCQLIDQSKGKYSKEFVEYLLDNGKCLIIVDGLDEASEKVKDVIIGSLVRIPALYKNNSVIVFSRPRSVPDGIYGFNHFSVFEFVQEQAGLFIKKWFKEEPSWNKLFTIINSDKHFEELAGNPLLLSIVCILDCKKYQIPHKKSDLYSRCLDALMFELDRAKGFKRDYNYKFINEFKRKDILATIAFFMQLNYYHEISMSGIEMCLSQTNYLKKIIDEGKLQNLLGSLEIEHGILIEWSKGKYTFPHRTFQEFLAAWYIERTRKEEWFIKALRIDFDQNLEWWREVAIILAHLLYDSTVYLRNLMSYSFNYEFKKSLLSEILIQDIACTPNIYDEAKERKFLENV